MKLYCDPISTTSRSVMMFVAEHGLDVEIVKVDLMAGAHQSPEYLAVNPNGIVPYLVDGDFALGECAAIIKYLAEKIGSPTYPSELKARAKVDEMVSWFHTQFHEYFSVFVCYPNMGVPHGLDPEIARGLMAYGRETAPRWLKVLDQHILKDRKYVAGDEITIADYLGLSQVLLGELAQYDFSPYPNIERWVGRMRGRPAFEPTYSAYFQVVAMIRAQQHAAAQAAE